jgi:hypothetical protein
MGLFHCGGRNPFLPKTVMKGFMTAHNWGIIIMIANTPHERRVYYAQKSGDTI